MYMKTGTIKYPTKFFSGRTAVILLSVLLICFSSMIGAADRDTANKTWIASWGASPTTFISF